MHLQILFLPALFLQPLLAEKPWFSRLGGSENLLKKNPGKRRFSAFSSCKKKKGVLYE